MADQDRSRSTEEVMIDQFPVNNLNKSVPYVTRKVIALVNCDDYLGGRSRRDSRVAVASL
ncbi:hypothetical protein NITHO_270011 [Nitrolancea hollandica Lb]|uniref:Uncharacterized protein n=1 Tax=Nitrolancea hollandica Lb TaxID=1129897 RepID=I4EGF3_9BACT|nr:hypothetical protein NITHO_270011 [Nitrolancea hollandica Lb]